MNEEDVGTYAIKAANDPRTLNKTVGLRPPANIKCYNELVSIWENKIGKTLQRNYVAEDQIMKNILGNTVKPLYSDNVEIKLILLL